MDKLNEAKEILKEIGMPKSQQSDLCAYTLLALVQLKADGKWRSITNEYIRIHDIMEFIKKEYYIFYAENSRELAWETEVWLSEMPDHMIHLNGDKFVGPR